MNGIMKTDLLRERLVALKSTKGMFDKKEQKRIKGEIRYIEAVLQAKDFGTYNER